MDDLKQKLKYKLVDKFLTEDELFLLSEYTIIRHMQNKNQFSNWIPTGDTWYYADPLMEALLKRKTTFVEKIVNKKLFPTYSFWRLYTNKATLPLHSDRPSCEISVTINLGGDKPWPIVMDEEELILTPGQAVIYLGQAVSHYRNEFDGDFSSQVFIHYVDQNGPNVDYKLDKRPDHWVFKKPND